MTAQDLDALVGRLREEFRRTEPRGGRIAELLGEYARTRSDWRPFALFSDQHYTRNLVTLESRFELMILCWGPGQESPIHNHEGQDCWMAVLDGEVEEVRFPMPSGAGPLLPRSSMRFTPGQVAFIRDEMGLHLVRPASTSASGGVTMHLYSAPYDECNCYCPDTGSVTRRKLGHHSVRGRVLEPRAAGPA
jgi:cysteine dioxygenase